MDINDASVLEIINNLIASDRLNQKQILLLIKLVPISNDIHDLKDNIEWENLNTKY